MMPDRRQFLGHPLTPNPVSLDERARKELANRIETADAIMANPVLLDRLVAVQTAVNDMHATLRRLGPELVWSGTALTDSTGVWSKRFGREVRSLWVQCGTNPAGTDLFATPAFAAGAALSYTLPVAQSINTITTVLVASATAANRYPNLYIELPSGQVIQASPGMGPFTAGSSTVLTWGPAAQWNGTGNPASAPLSGPTGILPAGTIITVVNNGGLAGDQFTNTLISGSAAVAPYFVTNAAATSAAPYQGAGVFIMTNPTVGQLYNASASTTWSVYAAPGELVLAQAFSTSAHP